MPGHRMLLRAGAACALLVVLYYLAPFEPESAGGELVVRAVFAAVIVFAAVDYMVAVSRPGQFQDLETKTDALYFAVTTMATVGYGDVHATGQLARGLVTGQLLVNLTVLATGGALLVNRVVSRGGRGR